MQAINFDWMDVICLGKEKTENTDTSNTAKDSLPGSTQSNDLSRGLLFQWRVDEEAHLFHIQRKNTKGARVRRKLRNESIGSHFTTNSWFCVKATFTVLAGTILSSHLMPPLTITRSMKK